MSFGNSSMARPSADDVAPVPAPAHASDGGGTATLYRMVMEDRLRPYGLKAKDLPEREGFDVDDNWLRTREETDARKSSSAATGSAATRA